MEPLVWRVIDGAWAEPSDDLFVFVWPDPQPEPDVIVEEK